MDCIVKLVWDGEVKRWHTVTDDNLCLGLEADTCDGLVEQVRLAAPEMLELNCGYVGPINLTFEVERKEHIAVA